MDNWPEGANRPQDHVLWGPPCTTKGFEAQWVQDHSLPLNGLILSEEFSQSLSPCSPKVIALDRNGLASHSCYPGWVLNSTCTPQGPGQRVDKAREASSWQRCTHLSFCDLGGCTATSLCLCEHFTLKTHSNAEVFRPCSPSTAWRKCLLTFRSTSRMTVLAHSP